MPPVSRIGDLSSHPGILTAPVALSVITADRPTAHIGTIHVCFRTDHPPTPVVTGIFDVLVEDIPVATIGSVVGCLAVLVTGATDVIAG